MGGDRYETKVIGFLTTPERPLARDLLGVQNYARRLDYTGRPVLTQRAAYTLGGMTHSVGPSHDVANQIFSPVYAISKIGGGRRGASPDIFSLFTGRRRRNGGMS